MYLARYLCETVIYGESEGTPVMGDGLPIIVP